MNRLNFVQLYKEDEAHFNIASSLWVPFIKEVHEHDGTMETDEQILDGLKKELQFKGHARICILKWRFGMVLLLE